jgi:hypothetical protein
MTVDVVLYEFATKEHVFDLIEGSYFSRIDDRITEDVWNKALPQSHNPNLSA